MNTTFATLIVNFFEKYLAAQKGRSENTIAAYSDSIRLLLAYCADRFKATFDKLEIEMIDEEVILDFLDHLENDRGNGAKTRNRRLAAIKTFFRFLALQEPTLAVTCERVCAISLKKEEHVPITPLDHDEVKAIFNTVDPDTLLGARDQALLMMLYNCGAREQEIIDLDVSDLRMEKPKQVTITGKGQKQRVTPLYDETVQSLKHYLDMRKQAGIDNPALFLNSRGERISRHGIIYIVSKRVAEAAKNCASLQAKKVTPHTFRHTIALHFIESNVDITVVKEWLGHASIKTTSMYVEINMQMKRKALEMCPPPSILQGNAQPQWQNRVILTFLKTLSRKTALC